MLVQRRFPVPLVFKFALPVLIFSSLWSVFVFGLYAFAGLHFLRTPFLPIATLGTAVAFYVGFKNNAAYERFWEGRKIWGGVVNASRTWGNFVVNYVRPGDESEEAQQLRATLIHRHLAWVNALRLQLRKTSRLMNKPVPTTRRRLRDHAEVMRNDWDKELSSFLSAEQIAELSGYANAATQLLVQQGQTLAEVLRSEKMDLFHQIAMMEVIKEFYALQGKAERIKNTPFPRQYAEYSRIFTRAFVVLTPFGLLDVFAKQIDLAQGALDIIAPAVPMVAASALVSWVFFTMEGIGDSSEDPFERSMNDVPMNALCRTIEIDLRQMLGETDLPGKEQPADGILY